MARIFEMPDLEQQSYIFVWVERITPEVATHSTTIAFPQLTATNEKLIASPLTGWIKQISQRAANLTNSFLYQVKRI